MTEKTIAEIKEELKSIGESLSKTDDSHQWDKSSKAIAATNYILFLAIVWKAFELNGQIPFLAKFSLLFFGLGILFSVFQNIMNWMANGMENASALRRLIEIEDMYGEELKKHDKEEYQYLKVINLASRISIKKAKKEAGDDDLPDEFGVIALTFLGMGATVISFALLSIGLLCLGASVFFI